MPTTNFPYGIGGPGIVQVVTTSPGTLPQTGNKTIFTVTGGPIVVEAVFGVVTTLIGAVANATKLQYFATGLTAVDLCATADLNAAAVGTIFSLTGTLATGAIIVAPNVNSLALDQATKWNILPGIIRINTAGSDGGTGLMQWYIRFRPYANFTINDPGPKSGIPVSLVTAGF